MINWWLFAAPAICTGILTPLAIRARSIGHDQPGGVQKLHVIPTSRLGGLVVVVGSLVALTIALSTGYGSLVRGLPLAIAAVPVVLVGLAEDLTRRVRPRYRMAAAVVSAMLASTYSGGVVPRLDLPLIDDLLKHLWFVLPLTWFMVAGACNAINLIDGAHGLAGGTALIMFGGIAMAAGWSGDVSTLTKAVVMMSGIIGFLLWNYPRGLIFLGDAGAYFIGFIYAELSIQLIARNSAISPWYVIMLAGYPIVDTLFAMYRRGVARGMALMAPDALHLHSLVFRRVAMPIERRLKNSCMRRANARVAPRLWLHSVLCAAFAFLFFDNTPALLTGLLAYAAFYVNRYRMLVLFRAKRARRWARVVEEGAEVAERSNAA